MVANEHLERLHWVMQKARASNRPFGGVQVIVTGDFCQLPPVKPFENCFTCGREMSIDVPHTIMNCPLHRQKHVRDKWAFCASVWESARFVCVNLSENHRQTDPAFISLLDGKRLGKMFTEEQKKMLLRNKNLQNATKLFPRREEARAENIRQVAKLQEKAKMYTCIDTFKRNPNHAHLTRKAERSADGTLMALGDHKYEPFFGAEEGNAYRVAPQPECRQRFGKRKQRKDCGLWATRIREIPSSEPS